MWKILSLLFILQSCSAYKTEPQSAKLFTADELVRRGVVLAPLAQEKAESSKLSQNDFATYDRILSNVLNAHWQTKNIPIMHSDQGLQSIGAENIEQWRQAVARGEGLPSRDTAQKIKEAYGSADFLIVAGRLLSNQVSCGQREAVPSYYNSDKPYGPQVYCQRLVKLQFQIFDRTQQQQVWSGLIYASEESSALAAATEGKHPDPPSLETLLRQAFKNFALTIAGSLDPQ